METVGDSNDPNQTNSPTTAPVYFYIKFLGYISAYTKRNNRNEHWKNIS